jgi:RNA polymerase sigma-B factor
VVAGAGPPGPSSASAAAHASPSHDRPTVATTASGRAAPRPLVGNVPILIAQAGATAPAGSSARAPKPCVTSRDITADSPFGEAAAADNRTVDHAANDGARSRLIEAHLPLVASIARRYAGGGEPLDDLVQVGAIGLIKAVDRFDPERGSALPAFAAPVIEGEIRHHLRDAARPVRRPRGLHELDGRVRAAERSVAAAGGRNATTAELARELGTTETAVAEAIISRRAPADPRDAVYDGAADLDRSEARVLLADAWGVLDDRQRDVLELRYFRDLTQDQIADAMGVSQAQVSRLIAGALTRLRRKLADGLADGDARAYSRSGMASTEAAPEQPPTHSGRLLVRMPPSLHAELARAAEREGVSLNTLITGALAGAVGWRSDASAGDDPASVHPAGTDDPPARRTWSSIALAANFAIVALAAVLAIVLLVVAWQGG